MIPDKFFVMNVMHGINDYALSGRSMSYHRAAPCGNILRPFRAGHVGGALLYLYPATGLHPAVGYVALSGLLKKLIALKGHNIIAMGVTRRTRKILQRKKALKGRDISGMGATHPYKGYTRDGRNPSL